MTTPAKQPNFCSVHAAAGSGKTYLLVSRLIVQLLRGAEPGSILAITFTRKAAAEMQQRLLQRVHELATVSVEELSEKLTALRLPDDASTRLQARALYERLLHAQYPVRTSTFHAFCQDLLRRFPMEAQIPPGFELTEQIGYLLDEAWEAYATALTRQPQSPDAAHMDYLLAELGLWGTRSLLYRFIFHRSEWWALQQTPGFELNTFLAALSEKLGVHAHTDPVQTLFANELLMRKCQKFSALLKQNTAKTFLEHADWIDAALNVDRSMESRFASLWKACFTDKNTPRVRKLSKALEKSLGASASVEYQQLPQDIGAALIAVKQQLHAQATYKLSEAWLSCGERLLGLFQKIKLEQRLLDFADLEWHAYLLLNEVDHAQWVQYKLDQRIDHLLIDEFQDTNPTQWHLILPLLTEIAAGVDPQRQRSVLFVGDSKQSIYRFRRAEPQLFAAATAWLETHLAASREQLNKSYRSSPAIIDFVNRLFSDNPQLSLEDFVPHQTERVELGGHVTLLPLIEKQDKAPLEYLRDPLQTPRQLADPAHYQEAIQVTEHIRQLIEAKTVITEQQQQRPINYGDILLLFRNRTHAQDYERALREAHIPYIGTERGTLLDSLEVKDMVNLLQWLITPFDNLALAGILRSPLFSISDSDLQLLAGAGNWYQHLQEIALQFDPQHPLARANLHLPRWIALAELLPVHDLLDHIYSEANVMARYLANYPDHLRTRVRANLVRFIELALETDSGRYPSLTRFLAWLNVLKQQDQEAPDQPAGGHESNRVRMLTIHEAKGLEAPVVFLLDCAGQRDIRKGPQVLVDWPPAAAYPETFFICPTGSHPHPYCEQTMAMLDAKQQQEETNLLYVAVTRAKQCLYLSGVANKGGWYDAVCERYQLEAASIAEPTTVQEQVHKIQLSDQTTLPAAGVIEIDARLRNPVALTPLLREIAPSQTHQHMLFAAGGIEEDQRERGRLIHHMLECLARQPDLSLEQYTAIARLAPREELLAYWAEAQGVVRHYPEFFHTSTERQYIEVPLLYNLDKTTVHGIMDRLIVSNDRVHIIDYKTHRIHDPDTLPAFAQQFNEQLQLYKTGVQRLFPDKAVTTSILFTALPQLVELHLRA